MSKSDRDRDRDQDRENDELRIAIERLQTEQALARIREDLIHGFHPKRRDLLRLWLFATGETISDGRRCSACGGEGADIDVPDYRQCSACGGLGWDVLPTAWERLAVDDEPSEGS